VLGSAAPLSYYLSYPEDFQLLIQEVLPLAAWAFSGALMFVLVGSLQGAASGFSLALADALWGDLGRRGWRWVVGLASGLALALLLTVLSFWGVTGPETGPSLYIPVYVLSGLASGAAATIVIPRMGNMSPFQELLKRSVPAIAVTMASTVPYALLLFPSTALQTFLYRSLYAIGFPLALALLFGRWRPNRQQSTVLTAD
jgi:hypothetical protein